MGLDILQVGNGGTTGSLSGPVINNGVLAYNRSDAVTLSGLISGSGAFEQQGAGVVTQTAANSYAGATRVNSGTLLINGDQSAARGLTTISSGAVLGGNGVIGGDVVLSSGATLTPGGSLGAVGTLAIAGDLSLAAGTTLDFQLGAANVSGGLLNDFVTVGGDLVLDGTLNVTVSPGGSFGAGIYRLFNYTGELTNNDLALGTTPVADLFVQTSVARQLNLINSTGLTLNYWDGPTGQNNGAIDGGNGVWQAVANDSWTEAAGDINATYANGAFAIFTGAGGRVRIDNNLGVVSASGLQFASNGYAIEGAALTLNGAQSLIRVGDGTVAGAAMTATIAAELTGAAQVVKSDAGALILSGANSYTGGTAINGGTLQIASDANLGDTAGDLVIDGGTLATSATMASNRNVNLAGAGALQTASGTTFTLNGPLSGAGAFSKSGSGTLVLTADNSAYAGNTNASAGTLVVNGALGGNMAVASGGRLAGRGQVGTTVNRGIIAPGLSNLGVLAIDGDYSSDGGRVEIEAVLGDDASVTDRLVIRGVATGVTQVSVVKRGGLGAQTIDGIKIIEETGGTAGAFVLDGDYVFGGEQAVIAGAYARRPASLKKPRVAIVGMRKRSVSE